MDLIEIDAASHTGVDHVRDLIEKMQFQPNVGSKKIYIIDEVHMLSRGAFNALLKTLEEPPDHVFFILATTELHKIPATVQSRCETFSFQRFSESQISQRLETICQGEGIAFETPALQQIARQATGGLRDAIFLLQQHANDGSITLQALQEELGLVSESQVIDFLAQLEHGQSEQALNLLGDIFAGGFALQEFSKNLLQLLRQRMLAQLQDGKGQELQFTLQAIEIFQEAHSGLKGAVVEILPLEIAVAKFTLAKQGADFDRQEREFATSGLQQSAKKQPTDFQTAKGQAAGTPNNFQENKTKPKEDSPLQQSKQESTGLQQNEKSANSLPTANLQKAAPGQTTGLQQNKKLPTGLPNSFQAAKGQPAASLPAGENEPASNLPKSESDLQKILSHVKNPTLKIALQNSTLHIEDGCAQFTFSAKSFQEKVETAESKMELTGIFKSVLDRNLQVQTKVESTESLIGEIFDLTD